MRFESKLGCALVLLVMVAALRTPLSFVEQDDELDIVSQQGTSTLAADCVCLPLPMRYRLTDANACGKQQRCSQLRHYQVGGVQHAAVPRQLRCLGLVGVLQDMRRWPADPNGHDASGQWRHLP